MNDATGTVMHNLIEGFIFVTVIVFLFMADWRTTLLISIIIPLSLLFAFLCLRLKGMGANLLSEFHKNIKFNLSLDAAIVEAVKLRTRPVVMTALMASIGLLPAATSTGIGSQSQKPLAIVSIGEMVTATILTLLVFPIIFWLFNHTKHEKLQ